VPEADDLRASRARLAVSAAVERRRIERALHDGVQQDLIAISVRLQLLRELLGADAGPALELLDELQRDTRGALERVRAVAADTYPPLLDARGLQDALREASRATGVSVRIEASGLGRPPADVEAAAYFCCRDLFESAGPGAVLTVAIRDSQDTLRIELAGGAFEVTSARDLAEAAGGALATGADGTVTVTFPLR
jgi:signal transduction histidine kinase